MKKLIWALLLALAICMGGMAAAEEETPCAVFRTFSCPLDSETIDLGEVYVNDFKVFEAFLDQLPRLRQVDMFRTPVSRTQIGELAEKYPDIEFGWTMKVGDHQIRTDATAFSTLHSNKSGQHRSIDFSVLKYCKKLLALDIGHNAVDDLSFLYDLPQLKVLIVACNQIKDITPVGSLTELEYLELFKNKIIDITPLQNCKKLLDLNICFNYIKDYSPIYGLDRLERLWIYNSNNYSESYPVPRAEVMKLQELLPDTHVDSTSYSTLGGWREHERYDVIYEMFKKGAYIPFPISNE